MDWRALPSLSSLRAFEAASRLRSFSAAGRELNVTHAAIAQQVRALEAELGLSLAFREGRGLGLTAEGQALSNGLRDGFGTIQTTISDLTEAQAGRPIRLSMTPSFANRWLMPRLGEFWKQHPDIPLSLHPERNIVDLRRDGRDIAIRCGRGDWPGVDAQMLMPTGYSVMATPSLMKGRKSLSVQEMSVMPWLAEDDWPEQFAWLRNAGLDPDTLPISRVETEELARAGARAGYGLHIEIAALCKEELEDGRLVEAFTSNEPGFGYYIVTRPGVHKPALRSLVRWLKSVVDRI
ncbi:LysR family transcriptional regulator [Flavimaricola marinus]|uniref:HTH-type transcriptional activator AmpR n=1 Tax=Flavimaricola marinus TaxID=1819565 RepID=A0A238LC04_9RHOB|nr:LysR family transcriptional regulator [Flavimaricola marinus]SMY07219.1 HTH-type transcriptional activator AmpR [Flavimaricola marinus]